MTHEVRFDPRARNDLTAIFDWIADHAGFDIADGYIERIETAYRKLTDFPRRGTQRDDLKPGLRTIAFERRATIAYSFEGATVTIERVLYGGRDVTKAFALRPSASTIL